MGWQGIADRFVNEFVLSRTPTHKAGRHGLSDFAKLLRQQVKKTPGARLSAPIWCSWDLTLNCNCRCIHCCADSGSTAMSELTTEDACRIADEIGRNGVLWVELQGGEPTLRHDLFAVIARLKRHGVAVRLLTNGAGPSDQTWVVALRSVLDQEVDSVQVSLDGACAEINDRIRGPGAFTMACKALENLTAQGIMTQVSTVLLSENLEVLSELYQLLVSIGGIRSWNLAGLMQVGRAVHVPLPDPREVMVKIVELKELERQSRGPVIAGSVGSMLSVPEYCEAMTRVSTNLAPTYRCDLGDFRLSIAANGDVYPCSFLTFPEFRLGNLCEESLPSIWHGSRLRQIKEDRDRASSACLLCPFTWCTGDCPAVAYARGDGLVVRDRHCPHADRTY